MNNQNIHVRLKQLSKFNNGNLNTLPNVFQCSKCKKYNNIILPENQFNIQNCYFCNNPNYIKNTK
jgi:hypothetical protein